MEQKVIKKMNKGGIVTLYNLQLQDANIFLFTNCQTQNVQGLLLNWNKLTWISMFSLSKFDWTKLTDIRLNWNNIGNKGCKYLSALEIPQIRSISLHKNAIGSSGFNHLAKAPWKKLQELHIGKNMICEGIKSINSADWPHFKFLFICMDGTIQPEITLLRRRQLICALKLMNLFSPFGVVLIIKQPCSLEPNLDKFQCLPEKIHRRMMYLLKQIKSILFSFLLLSNNQKLNSSINPQHKIMNSSVIVEDCTDTPIPVQQPSYTSIRIIFIFNILVTGVVGSIALFATSKAPLLVFSDAVPSGLSIFFLVWVLILPFVVPWKSLIKPRKDKL